MPYKLFDVSTLHPLTQSSVISVDPILTGDYITVDDGTFKVMYKRHDFVNTLVEVYVQKV